MKYTIILILGLLLIGCTTPQDCDNKAKYKVGDLVGFKISDTKLIISYINVHDDCHISYDGHYFDDKGERQFSIYIAEYELEPVEGETYLDIEEDF